MSRQAVPTTYAGWKTEALAMDSLEQSYQYIAKDSQPAPRMWTAPNHPPPHQPVPSTTPQLYNPPVQHQAPNPPNQENIGDRPGTYLGMGVPMDWSVN